MIPSDPVSRVSPATSVLAAYRQDAPDSRHFAHGCAVSGPNGATGDDDVRREMTKFQQIEGRRNGGFA